MSRRFVLLGASRGLGWATYQELHSTNGGDEFLLSSRRILQRVSEVSSRTQFAEQDFSKPGVDAKFLERLQKFSPTHLIYFAGGGPYGFFPFKKWSDHEWALRTTFLYPAELLHTLLSQKERWPLLQKVIFIGSQIAENTPDPKAASYAAAKHALRGLVSTVIDEKKRGLDGPDVALFSPGYMQTDMLPANSEPRQSKRAEDPYAIAKKLIAVIEKND